MKILVMVKDAAEQDLLKKVGEGIKKSSPTFDWTITTDFPAFEAALGCYKIVAESMNSPFPWVDLVWPRPSAFMKDAKLKEKVWNDIQNTVLPLLSRPCVETKTLSISAEELQQLLRLIGQATKPFKFTLPDGTLVGINTDDSVDTSFTSADIASMLAASWIFGAKGVRIT